MLRLTVKRPLVLAAVVLACTASSSGCDVERGSDEDARPRSDGPATIDETVGSYRGIRLGDTENDVRRVFGEPAEGEGFFPAGESFGEIGGAPGVAIWPHGSREAPTVLRYDDAAFLVGPRGVFAFVVTEDGAATKRHVGIGDPLQRARRVYGAGCGEQSYGEPLFSDEAPSFPWCRTTIDDRIRLWFGRDPIRSITLARVGPE